MTSGPRHTPVTLTADVTLLATGSEVELILTAADQLAAKGIMHEGYYSMQLGLRGIPAGAEVIMAARDITLAEMTGGRIHLMTLSTAGAVDQVRRAKAKGIRVTAEVTRETLCRLRANALLVHHRNLTALAEKRYAESGGL